MEGFVNRIITLDNIRQWEERDSVIKESVSQHSFKVSAIAIYLLEKVSENSNVNENWRWNVFAYNCIKYAVLHDFDESVLGRDISHVVKYNRYNGETIRGVLDDFVNHELRRMNLQFIREDIDPKVKTFVKLCDWIALFTFIRRNKDMGVSTFDYEDGYCRDKMIEGINVVNCMLEREFGNYGLNLQETFNNLIDYIKK